MGKADAGSKDETLSSKTSKDSAFKGKKRYSKKGHNNNNNHQSSSDKLNRTRKQLGKWFPSAQVLKGSLLSNTVGAGTGKDADPGTVSKTQEDSNLNATISSPSSCSILLFYQYALPQWTKQRRDQLINHIMRIARDKKNLMNLGGRIRVAQEGVNATISGTYDSVRELVKELIAFDPNVFDHNLNKEKDNYKYIDNLSLDRAFKDLKVFPVNELVFYGINEDTVPLEKGGIHLPPEEFHKKMQSKEAVIIDVRNHYEADIGRFDKQTKIDGAEYIDPKMRKSTDFPIWLTKPETKATLEGKEVLMYCTGGVRCERASALLNKVMGDEVKGVYQLHGGIEKYLQKYEDGGFWNGKNFVFDKREAISKTNSNGVGGVVISKKKKKKENANKDEEDPELSKCCVCEEPWDRYIGKKKCYTCGVPVLCCDKCLSKKPDESVMRCPLCIEENITVPVENVDYTNNGIGTSFSSGSENKGEGKTPSVQESNTKIPKQTEKAAPSVLKWGGGVAKHKREKRERKRKECRFGADCKKNDCKFFHPNCKTAVKEIERKV